jgi:hypothetical protein
MPSRAQKIRNKKDQARRAMLERVADAPLAPATPKPRLVRSNTAAEKHAPPDDGLSYLQRKNRLSPEQAEAGRIYRTMYRTASIEGTGALKSCLAGLDSAVGGGGAGGLPTSSLEEAEWIAECRAQLATARGVLQWDEDLINLVDLICGRGLKPSEISDARRETEQIETALRVALDLLRRHFAGSALRWRLRAQA